jgi:hypothetical protein
VFLEIKNYSLADIYYQSSSSEIPSLMNIEKKIKGFKYKNINDFLQDLRKVWSYYFEKYPNIYHKTVKISEYTEKIFKDLEMMNDNTSDLSEINKRVETLERNLKDMKGNKNTCMQMQNNKRLGGNSNNNMNHNTMDKKMTAMEKSELGKDIKELNREQLKEMLRLLGGYSKSQGQKSYEIDLHKIPDEKLRELQRYVKRCNSNNKKNLNNNNNNNNIGYNSQVNTNANGNGISNSNTTMQGVQNKSINNNMNVNEQKNNDIIKRDNDSLSSSESESESLSSLS